MAAGDFELRLVEDNLASGKVLELEGAPINRVIYVVHGAIEVAGRHYGDDEAWHGKASASIRAGAHGAALWRFELAPAGTPPTSAPAGSGASRSKLAAPLPWPVADKVLIRTDSVAFPPGGCAYLHTHQGPGIRCLIEGGIRIDTEGHSMCHAPGGAWFESGPAPVFAQAAADRPTRFIRCMVLPARLKGQSSIAYVNAEDRDKPKSQRYKVFVDESIDA